MKVSIQFIFNYVFSAFFQDICGYGGASGKEGFGFDTVKEIVILELVEGVMNALQNNEVIDVGNVAEAYQDYTLQIIFTP